MGSPVHLAIALTLSALGLAPGAAHLMASVREMTKMRPYQDTDDESGVVAYRIGAGSITIRFRSGGTYLYDASAPGAAHVAEMQRLARAGDGLNTYINKYVRKNYAAML